MNTKKLTYLVGFVTDKSEIETIQREGKTPVEKITLTIETEDGQKGYFEARKKLINVIHNKGIKIGDKVKFGFIFLGSNKNGKIYNNFFINEIEHVK